MRPTCLTTEKNKPRKNIPSKSLPAAWIWKNCRKSASELTTISLSCIDMREATHPKKDCTRAVLSPSFCGIRCSHRCFLSINTLAQVGIQLHKIQDYVCRSCIPQGRGKECCSENVFRYSNGDYYVALGFSF